MEPHEYALNKIAEFGAIKGYDTRALILVAFSQLSPHVNDSME